MELFASPMACSARLAYHGARGRSAGQGPLRREQEDRRRRRLLPDLGQGLRAGALRLDDGQVLNEGPSVLQYLADAQARIRAGAGLGHASSATSCIDTLNYLSTEVHKRIFANVFNPTAAEPTKAAARALFEPTLDYLAKQLGSGDYLVGNKFTVADAYLVTHAELVRLPQGRPRQVADASPPITRSTCSARRSSRRWASRWPSASARAWLTGRASLVLSTAECGPSGPFAGLGAVGAHLDAVRDGQHVVLEGVLHRRAPALARPASR